MYHNPNHEETSDLITLVIFLFFSRTTWGRIHIFRRINIADRELLNAFWQQTDFSLNTAKSVIPFPIFSTRGNCPWKRRDTKKNIPCFSTLTCFLTLLPHIQSSRVILQRWTKYSGRRPTKNSPIIKINLPLNHHRENSTLMAYSILHQPLLSPGSRYFIYQYPKYALSRNLRSLPFICNHSFINNGPFCSSKLSSDD